MDWTAPFGMVLGSLRKHLLDLLTVLSGLLGNFTSEFGDDLKGDVKQHGGNKAVYSLSISSRQLHVKVEYP